MAPHSSLRLQEPCGSPPNWLELPVDVCASIIKRLGVVHILTRAQHVCSTWRRICRDPSMWTSIDIIMCVGRHTELYQLAVDLSSGGLITINMEGYVPDGLLRYISDRSKHLRNLRLVYCAFLSDQELIEVAGKNPLLEALELSYCYRTSSQAVAAVGRLCPLLNSLKLNSPGCDHPSVKSDDEAFAIANNMPALRQLQIFGNKLTNAGLIAILDGCPQLESLDLRQCFHVSLDADLERRCTEQIKHFRGPNDSTDDYPFNSDVDNGLSDDDDDDDLHLIYDGADDDIIRFF